jgi:uncharacterized membrane protein YhaH (DUF805 family)
MNWYLEVLKKYAVFSGRARRKEFWMFMLFNVIVGMILGIVATTLASFTLGLSFVLLFGYYIAVLLPIVGVRARRLHDISKSGWWLLLYFVPFGGIVLLIFFFTDSTPGDNLFGPNPKGVAAPAA